MTSRSNAQFASATTDLHERAGELLAIGEHAADGDPDLRRFAEAGARDTRRSPRGLPRRTT
jgi:hypothetical protein